MPRASRVLGYVPLPPAPAPSGTLRWFHSPTRATWVLLRDLGRPSLPTHPPTGLAFQLPQPPSGERGPLGGAATGSGVGGRAGARARAALPPGAGGGRPLSSRGRVNALHLGPAEAGVGGWGVFLRGSWTQTAPRLGLCPGSGRPSTLSSPRAGGGDGRRRWGGGRGRGRGLGARRPVIG